MRVAVCVVFFLCSWALWAVDSPSVAAGQETYEHFCIVCHRDGLAGAPKFQDNSDWSPRIKAKTVDELVGSVLKGMNVMPEKGTCTECTEVDLKAAVEYMLPKS